MLHPCSVRASVAPVAALVLAILTGCSNRSGEVTTSPGLGPATASHRSFEDATVDKVIDGDTITVSRDGHEATVRLLGIDTPETKRPDTPVECFGEQAHDRLASLLPAGTAIRLEHDQQTHDRYDRELAHVWRAEDGLFVNLTMVAEGFAAPLTIRPNLAHANEIGQAADEAHLTARGLWSACGSGHRPLR